MATSLFDKIVYGPVKSRRLGVSLGINISPSDGKRCTFNCIYCECGLNEDRRTKNHAPKRDDVRQALIESLTKMAMEDVLPDVITFSGNGEPTMHPEFAEIIDDTIDIRNRLCPTAKVAVLSNSTMIHKQKVVEALHKVDENLMKLDAVDDKLIRIIDQPELNDFTAKKIVEQLQIFKGKLIIQTIFFRGKYKGELFDNSISEHVDRWIEALIMIDPYKVMIYTINRDTPVKNLEKLSVDELESIAVKVRNAGFDTTVSA
jgi:wyosine [tRNA(Phe)-imidazoG37] synthetase (radical SAM superfamily)